MLLLAPYGRSAVKISNSKLILTALGLGRSKQNDKTKKNIFKQFAQYFGLTGAKRKMKKILKVRYK